MSRFIAMTLGIVCILTVALPSTGACGETDEQTVKAILRDWAARRNSIKTFHYVCALAKVEKVIHGETDPFGGPVRPGESAWDEAVTKTMTLSYDNGKKLAWREEGEEWSEDTQSKVPYLLQYAFNEKGNVHFLQQAQHSAGTIDHRNKPDSALISALDHMPIWFTFDPSRFFKRPGLDW